MDRADPVESARHQRNRGRRVRLLYRVAAAFSRRSYRVDQWLRSMFGVWRPYLDADDAVAIHAAASLGGSGSRRLLLVSHELTLSGAPRLVGEIAALFAQQGWRVIVVSPTDGPARHAMHGDATVIIDPTVLMRGSPMMRRLAADVDLAICNTVAADGAVCTLAPRVPTLWYLHEVSLLAERLATDPVTVAALAAAAQVWAGSEISAAIARPWRNDIRVQPYGIRPPAESADRRPPAFGAARPIDIAVFGAFEPRKGQDLAVEALACLSAADRASLRLSLYGRVLDKDFAARVAESGRDLPVRWGGELDMAGYKAAMAATDVVLVSSRDDTLPLVSLDALGSRRLLLCTPGVGTSAWIGDGESGFVAAAGRPEAIAAMLTRALACRSEWPAIVEQGRAVFDASFSEDAFARAMLAMAATLSRPGTPDG